MLFAVIGTFVLTVPVVTWSWHERVGALGTVLFLTSDSGNTEVAQDLCSFRDATDNLCHDSIGSACLDSMGLEGIVLQCP
jgi:hypothetical protein